MYIIPYNKKTKLIKNKNIHERMYTQTHTVV